MIKWWKLLGLGLFIALFVSSFNNFENIDEEIEGKIIDGEICYLIFSQEELFHIDSCTKKAIQENNGGNYCTLCTNITCEIYKKGEFLEQKGLAGCLPTAQTYTLSSLNTKLFKEYDGSVENYCYQKREFPQMGILPCTQKDIFPYDLS